MIEEISISQAGTYNSQPQKMSTLTPINYIYGANGVGKTTISKIINNCLDYPACSVNWCNRQELKSFVYNRDFVENNFRQDNIKGIFTLGENASGVQDEIDSLNAHRKKESDQLDSMENQLNIGTPENPSVVEVLLKLEDKFKKTCWDKKVKYDDIFSKAFKGVRGTTESFKERVLKEYQSRNDEYKDLSDLENMAGKVFSDSLQQYPLITIPAFDRLIEISDSDLFKESIFGRNDSSVSDLINALDNSDWVKQGLGYCDDSDGKCPFCQQETPYDLKSRLESYFDKTYENKKNKINQLVMELKEKYAEAVDVLSKLMEGRSTFVDKDLFESQCELLLKTIESNVNIAERKLSFLSQSVELNPLSTHVDNVLSILRKANKDIQENNNIFLNRKEEGENLTREIWNFIVSHELKEDIEGYLKEKNILNKKRSGLESGIENKKSKIAEINEKITVEEAKRTSVKPTIEEINKILRSFGFKNFYLECSQDNYHYKILRADGSDALKTLSEGEKTFVTFLYFFCLIKGSNAESGITEERVVVFDDPVSSLDSDILFIVSSLIKKVIKDVQYKSGAIKQVFCLTHNIYFHKELTFDIERRTERARPFESFWVVRKKNGSSFIECHDSNPIKNSYELLWAEIRRDDANYVTLQNTMRRILENYFKILGGIDVWTLENKFYGEEKYLFKALFSWVNDGSHYSNDDLYVNNDESVIDKYRIIFHKIFHYSEHTAHYKMMMGEKYLPLEDESFDVISIDEDSANDDFPEKASI